LRTPQNLAQRLIRPRGSAHPPASAPVKLGYVLTETDLVLPDGRTPACGALLPDRVVAAVSVCGLAPFGAEGLDWFAEHARHVP
jgi:hypothetical protein